MASETIDKSMLEAMTCGCYPVTTKGNAAAIGITDAPTEDLPQAIAAFIQKYAEELPLDPDQMYRIVEEGHSLVGLIRKMGEHIHGGC
jgi:hypothetical protein